MRAFLAGTSRAAPVTRPLVLFKVGAGVREGEAVDWVAGVGEGEEMRVFDVVFGLAEGRAFLAGTSLAAPATWPLVFFKDDACGSGGGTFSHLCFETTSGLWLEWRHGGSQTK